MSKFYYSRCDLSDAAADELDRMMPDMALAARTSAAVMRHDFLAAKGCGAPCKFGRKRIVGACAIASDWCWYSRLIPLLPKALLSSTRL